MSHLSRGLLTVLFLLGSAEASTLRYRASLDLGSGAHVNGEGGSSPYAATLEAEFDIEFAEAGKFDHASRVFPESTFDMSTQGRDVCRADMQSRGSAATVSFRIADAQTASLLGSGSQPYVIRAQALPASLFSCGDDRRLLGDLSREPFTAYLENPGKANTARFQFDYPGHGPTILEVAIPRLPARTQVSSDGSYRSELAAPSQVEDGVPWRIYPAGSDGARAYGARAAFIRR
jgi:hypothetical protein